MGRHLLARGRKSEIRKIPRNRAEPAPAREIGKQGLEPRVGIERVDVAMKFVLYKDEPPIARSREAKGAAAMMR